MYKLIVKNGLEVVEYIVYLTTPWHPYKKKKYSFINFFFFHHLQS